MAGSKKAISVKTNGFYSISDTFECGQCFRAEKTVKEDGYEEYTTVLGNKILRIGQKTPGELIIFDTADEEFDNLVAPYLSLYTDYEEIRKEIISKTDSDWLKNAAECARGIAILSQDAWETLLSFIVSQNNNIPRIKGIIRKLAAEYGVNICLQNGYKKCPFNKIDTAPCEEICKNCGACYTFPSAADIAANPEKMLAARPGFRYKYLCDAAEKVARGDIDLQKIKSARSYETTKDELKKIKGVGDKVAACCALFGFENFEAFPIDVWMKRAIDTYFDGRLDYEALGRYAGIAQQYIFHYIRNIESI